MTIWILAIVLVASLAGLGLRQGAVRVAFSFVGILFAALLASPIGSLLSPLTGKIPIWGSMLGPVIAFIFVLSLFKIAGATAHRKITVRYKHKDTDANWKLWLRMNQRLGLCLGVANGALYLMLVSFAIYAPTYWTYQLGQSAAAENSRAMSILNRFGEDLQRTGMARVAGAVRSLPDAYYDAGDIVGLVYNNPALSDRLSRYPDFINLAAKPELQDIAHDADLIRMKKEGAPVSEMLANPKIKELLGNNAVVKAMWAQLTPDLKDLRGFLETGKSAKYDQEKLLGKWYFNASVATAAFRKAKPVVSLAEMRNFRALMAAFANTTFSAGPAPDSVAVLDGIPTSKPGETTSSRGTWKPDGTDFYDVIIPGETGTQEYTASVDATGRLTINLPGYSLGFLKAP